MKKTWSFWGRRLIANLFIVTISCVGLKYGNAHAQSDQTTNTSPGKVKAYKTLFFGDDTKTVENKLAEIVGGPEEKDAGGSVPIKYSEAVWNSFFDTDVELESFEAKPNNHEFLMRYLSNTVGVDRLTYKNSAISVNCYQLGKWLSNNNRDGNGGGDESLAVIEVNYSNYDLGKLIEAFTQNYPNAQKGKKPYRIESETYPGIFLEFERVYFSDINSERRAKLFIPSEKFTFVFTEPANLSKDQLATWNNLMAQNGSTNINEFFESAKSSILKLGGKMESDKKLDDYSLSSLGWGQSKDYESIIYGSPTAVFTSKQILGLQLKNFLQSLEARDKAEKVKLKAP